MHEREMKEVGVWVANILKDIKNESLAEKVRGEVRNLTKRFPLYEDIHYA
jgi:glycine hydroxymethyltransferase